MVAIGAETGAVGKEWGGRHAVALGYPNVYDVGMENLGFQAVYTLLNDFPDVVAERFFLSAAAAGGTLTTCESVRPVAAARVILFSVSFEQDYVNLVRLLRAAGLAPHAAKRAGTDPPVVVGGIAPTLNPLPLAPFVDAVLVGEAEVQMTPLVEGLRAADGRPRADILAAWDEVPGIWRPATDRGRIVRRAAVADLDGFTPQTVIRRAGDGKSPFAAGHLVEVNRGCPHGCRFCAAGYVYLPFRNRSLPVLTAALEAATMAGAAHVGLIGSALGDHPDLLELCRWLADRGVRFSPASLRADRLTPELLELLCRGGAKTVTIAPEAGSEVLRFRICKKLTDEQILVAAERAAAAGIYGLKLYFLVGLPGETPAARAAIVSLTAAIRKVMLAARRERTRSVRLVVSINPLVPKPHTPLQWAAFAGAPALQAMLRELVRDLQKIGGVQVECESPLDAAWQTLLSRGDERLAPDLLAAAAADARRRAVFRTAVDRHRGILERLPTDAPLPWDFIRPATAPAVLEHRYRQAFPAAALPS